MSTVGDVLSRDVGATVDIDWSDVAAAVGVEQSDVGAKVGVEQSVEECRRRRLEWRESL
jgi:hypothetical protein